MRGSIRFPGERGRDDGCPAAAAAEPTPAATTASSPSTAKINKCVQDLQFLAQTDMEPLEQFNKFVDEVCLGLDLRVPSKYSS